MGRYYFNIRNGRPFTDTEGLELPSLKAVREEAMGGGENSCRKI